MDVPQPRWEKQKHTTASVSESSQVQVAQRVGKEMTSRDEAADVQAGRAILGNAPFGGISAKAGDGPSSLTRADGKAGGIGGTARGSRVAGAGSSLRKDMVRGGPHETQQTTTRATTRAATRAATNSPAADTAVPETTFVEELPPRPLSYTDVSHDSSSDSPSTPAPPTARYLSPQLGKPDTKTLATAMAEAAVPYVSTTDDDDVVPLHTPSASNPSSGNTNSLQATAQVSQLRRRHSRTAPHTSLSTVQSPTDLALEEEWDYSETEWWGWIILITTWIVFVVGMGSCLGVWTWAWDVGETPYAPPELEDDPTLPITGYYPALMVCTAVMAWVWVVVAWVGMKYFRHAKMASDDR